MKIKTAELFCASPASTAICTTMNHHAMVRRGGASTPKSKFKPPPIPCTSHKHIDPKPYTAYLQKNRKSTSAASTAGKNNNFPARRKSSAELNDRNSSGGSSSRHLLEDHIFVEDLVDSGDVFNGSAVVVSEQACPDDYDDLPVIKQSFSLRRSRGDESPALVKERSSSLRLPAAAETPVSKSSRPRSCNQVVELRVSIHCKECEGKVRKHISRMEGVKSFHIDLESKKVTVVGDITPLSVLASISKVKNAQLWPSSSPFIAIGY